MTGKLLLENEPNYVLQHIKLKYGDVGNYYNEVYNAHSDFAYAIEKDATGLVSNAENRLKFLEEELISFDSEIANEIFLAIKLDAEIENAKRTIDRDEQLLDKLDYGNTSFWHRLKIKLGI